jgi:hypothetical protein
MRTGLKIAALAISLAAPFAAPAAPSGGTAGEIVTGTPPTPTKNTLRVEGNCGATRYGVTVDDRYEDPARRLRSLTVNGRKLSAAARNRVVSHLRPAMWIMQAAIDRCGTTADRARVRLTISERRQQAIETRFFDFWVGPDGSISDVRFN